MKKIFKIEDYTNYLVWTTIMLLSSISLYFSIIFWKITLPILLFVMAIGLLFDSSN